MSPMTNSCVHGVSCEDIFKPALESEASFSQRFAKKDISCSVHFNPTSSVPTSCDDGYAGIMLVSSGVHKDKLRFKPQFST
jgi:hypothetical protein